jgi:outer membrane protein assembly factor BamE
MSRLRNFALAALFLAGCSQVPTIPNPISAHKIDIQQGNVVTQEMVDKLRPGMTQSQVRFILGTPLVVDTFHKDRWDYVYRYEKSGSLVEHRRLIVVFENDKLARLEGDVVAAKPRAPEPAQAGKPAAGKPAAPKSAEAVPPGANPAPASPDPVAAPAGPADAAAGAPQGGDEKSKEEKPQPEKPKDERGFFGRMLERLGL